MFDRALPLAALLTLTSPLLAENRMPNSDEWPSTRPERTENAETSTLDDVTAFLDALVAGGAPIRLETLGTSPKGRSIPLVVCARPMVTDGDAARASGRIVVYLQANIHGGEVEGKEAVQQLLREIAMGEHAPWLERCVFIVTPIYNVDGNEEWGEGLKNRGHQNGPVRIGQRPNGDDLDLNRDCVKAESPEMCAALTKIYRRFDPHVVLDLHTTNGTRHGYTLTYAPPLHPNTDPGVLAIARDTLLPRVRAKMLAAYGEGTNDYGNVEGKGEDHGWRTFSPLGRYVTNYVGLRNRIAVLSEATSFLPLGTRIDSTRRFAALVIDFATEHAGEIAESCREADRRATRGEIAAFGTSFAQESRGDEAVPIESEGEKRPPHESTGALVEVTLPIFDRFRSETTRALPRAYWLPAAEARTIALLRRHGVEVEPCRVDGVLAVEEFRIAEFRRSESAFQGHRQVRLGGEWTTAELPATTASSGYRVSTGQPLARLIFEILEPDLEDSAVAWEITDASLEEGGVAAVRRIP